ncbi:MAG: cupin [Candidatus Omnitrophica bacterium]|nr:cupin [Candidatus Omnitrophota bacterium]
MMNASPSRSLDAELAQRLAQEGFGNVTRWSNDPHAVYAVHDHPYGKVLFVTKGSITFVLEPSGRRLVMTPDDRLDIPAHTPHRAVVGPDGVVCLEAHREVEAR